MKKINTFNMFTINQPLKLIFSIITFFIYRNSKKYRIYLKILKFINSISKLVCHSKVIIYSQTQQKKKNFKGWIIIKNKKLIFLLKLKDNTIIKKNKINFF